MTLRIIGAIIITIGCGCGGFMLAAGYRREIRVLRAFVDMLNYLECELQYRSPPLSDLFKSFAKTGAEPLAGFSQRLSEELDAQICPDVQACVAATLDKTREIPHETTVMLSKLGATLGKFCIDGQILEIKSLRKEAEGKLDGLLNDQDVKTKNYKTLGLCAGAAIAILLI